MVDRIERNKDLVQELVESTATHVGQIATIITGAVAGVAREIGDLVTDGFEMRDAARKARQDEERGILDVGEEDILEGGDAVDDEIGDPVDLGELPTSGPAALPGADDAPEEPVDVGELPGEQP
ncbi:hypothetical protein [Gordonia hankookensis]|uniref:Uncharacterized protein n=1 Tax=Gordonia hankookensis TaxID=589403 RepID=A0ABR7WEF3_9ACTN|nr:hypothetical protein [Gordonia hankookensis]MBD1321138.1 hypothetical protein [Gordonia hankookensis]NDZ96711.1 hypothetical protein [Streptomyces sp. SID11726]NEB23271.1 hypothetical protein [Streptomyces sp. SID6673]